MKNHCHYFNKFNALKCFVVYVYGVTLNCLPLTNQRIEEILKTSSMLESYLKLFSHQLLVEYYC